MVVPPSDFAPRQAAAITPVRPLHTSTAPRLATSRPTCSASRSISTGHSEPPMMPTCDRLIGEQVDKFELGDIDQSTVGKLEFRDDR